METAGRYVRAPTCHVPPTAQLRSDNVTFLSRNSLNPGRPSTTHLKDDFRSQRPVKWNVASSQCRQVEVPGGLRTSVGNRVRSNKECGARDVSDTGTFTKRQVAARAANAAEKGGGEVKRIAVFVSGGGSNLKSIFEAGVNGSIFGRVVLVVSDKPGQLI